MPDERAGPRVELVAANDSDEAGSNSSTGFLAALILPALLVGAALLVPVRFRAHARSWLLVQSRRGASASRQGLVRVRDLGPPASPRRLRKRSRESDAFYQYAYAPALEPDSADGRDVEFRDVSSSPRPEAHRAEEIAHIPAKDSATPPLGACAACGTSLPTHARFCHICGAARAVNGSSRGARARPEANGHAPDAKGSAPEILTIELWRGYVKAEFVATVSNGERSFVAARSSQFPCWSASGPSEDDPRALAAFDALIEALDPQGWEPVEGKGPWYSLEFRRRSDGIKDLVNELSVHPVRRGERDIPEQERKH